MTEIQNNISLTELTTFGCTSTAEHFALVRTLEDLKHVCALARARNLRVRLLGGGANTIARSTVKGLVLKIDLRGIDIVAHGDDEALVTVGAGERFDDVIAATIAAGYSGLENLTAIPGTVGGAVVQNIGAYGVELAEHFVSVRVWDRQQEVERVLTLPECDFAYRHSVFKMPKAAQWVILSAVLRVSRTFRPVLGYKDVELALEREGIERSQLTPAQLSDIIRSIRARKLPNPLEVGNAGSFFKNPIVNKVLWRKILTQDPRIVSYKLGGGRMKFAAASLIEAAGLKGCANEAGTVGVSPNHALILINRGGASGEAVLDFAKLVADRVQETFGVRLEMEPVVL